MKKLTLLLAIILTSGTIGWLCSYQYYMDDSLLPTHIQYVVMPDNAVLHMGDKLQVTEYSQDHIKIVKR